MSSSSRPVVGVTGPDRGGGPAWVLTAIAVWVAGGRPVRIRPCCRRSVRGLDALIIGGGADVNPSLYGQSPLPLPPPPSLRPRDESAWLYLLNAVVGPLIWLARRIGARLARTFDAKDDRDRDAMEFALMDAAVRRRIPVLGICRGEQLLNVYFGGTLHQSLVGYYVEEPELRSPFPRKRIEVAAGSRLERALGTHPRKVNALHRQAIDRLGDGLTVAARDLNRIVQAIEHATLPWVVGVQWHPEFMPQVPEQRAIFRELVQAAREHRAVRTQDPRGLEPERRPIEQEAVVTH
ncbi:MAG TPA: gamma-glutamyl-gamma-aminobutyrate hydrolase family protein [Tepidisphaeraceae bacterium]|nr:gamma-glutamyl-gamma-aminobutyrate hydrolase family protein [Tepidisphaeraceae bacterium]